jgi:glycosyltransferase involved in cell wall biosynthesis
MSTIAEFPLAVSSNRILHILRAPAGGLFRHVFDLAREQARMGYEVGIICNAAKGVEAAEERLRQLRKFCTLGIFRVRMSRMLSVRDIAAFAAIRRHVLRLQPHVLHGHGSKGGAFARLMSREMNHIAIYTPHGGALHYTWHRPPGALYLALERFLRRRSDGLAFESEFGAHAYQKKLGAPHCPSIVVPNGLHDSDFAPLEEREMPYDAAFIGELRKIKGVSTLIEAVAKIASERPFRLAIAGTGRDEAAFRAEVAANGLENNIDFLGYKEAREVFALTRMVVVPSHAESFPYVVLEAIAAGRPVIATDIGGIPEIFGPHRGALVRAADADALATAMNNMSEKPTSATALSADLRERVRRIYSSAAMARKITGFYAEAARLKREPQIRPHMFRAQKAPAIQDPQIQ